jgi:branched-chain amino acid transport system ATP-binding protein
VALGLAGHAHVMEGGRIRFSGPASDLRENPDLLRSAYLLRGSTAEDGQQPTVVPQTAAAPPSTPP